MESQPHRKWLIPLVVAVVACLALTCVGTGGFWLAASVAPRWVERWRGQSPAEEPAIKTGEVSREPTESPRTREAGEETLTLPGGEPPTLDPSLSQDATSARYIVEIFSGLVTLDQELNIVPDIAESWELGDEGTVYTFRLREDVRFHDGKPVTAENFKFAIERACDPRIASVVADTYLGDIVGTRAKLRGQADEVTGVEVLDEHTLRITIDAPKPYFLAKLSHSTAFALDPENIEEGGRTWADHPNGTGPFRLAEYQLGERIVLERNPNYYGEAEPQLDRVIYILAGGSAMTMYENGELDAVPVGLADIERATDPANPLNKELTIAPTLSTFYLGFNVSRPPFDDVRVRQAFSHALDKQKIVDVIYKKMVPVAWTVVPPDMPGYDNSGLEPLTFDLEAAKELIAESGYEDAGNFPEITIYTTGAGGATSRVIEAIVGMYEENLGIRIGIEQTDWATFLMEISRPENPYQMYSLGWIADYPDPQNFLDVLFHSQSLDNHMGYSNPEVDRVLEEARTEQDHAERMALYLQAEQIILDDCPWVPLQFDVDYWLAKPYVEGMTYPPMIIPYLQYISINR
jgi:oligopeptide transport system substrate-binding protein